MRNKAVLVFLVFAFACYAGQAAADGFIVPDPDVNLIALPETPISVKYHDVKVSIKDQFSKTDIDQSFQNLSDRDIEGKYLFPLPEGAVISDFTMKVKGEDIKGKILGADEARDIYENIVSKLRDPALLEYVGRNLFQARVYPIPARGEVPVSINYSEVLKKESGVVRYAYTLDTEKFSARSLERVSITVDLESKQPIRTIYSPTHKIDIERKSDFSAKITYYEENVKPDKDFVLIYTVSDDDIGVSLLAHHAEGEEGFFALLITPKYELKQQEVQAKNVVFVLDTSGSMSGDKIVQAKKALEFILNNLNPDDSFRLVSFADEVESHDSGAKSELLKTVWGLDATGGTNINQALITSLGMFRDNERPNFLIFLTDGEPTVGIQGTDDILSNAGRSNSKKARIFVFGVGDDVNTHLLDKLADGNGGATEYVRPGENIEVAVSNFFRKISNPVLSDLKIDIPDVKTYDIFPRALPDLFKGSQLMLFGRYSGSGDADISLWGKVGRIEERMRYSVYYPRLETGNEYLPQLWAARKIGYLIDTIRLEGKSDELVNEVISLSKKYGIVTPYTSYLINPEGDEREAMEELEMLSSAPVSGKGAVDTSLQLKSFKRQAQTLDQDEEEYGGHRVGDYVQQYDSGAFILNKENMWVDSSYKDGDPTIKIKLFSREYFDLLKKHPEAGRYMSMGDKVIFKAGGKYYEVVKE